MWVELLKELWEGSLGRAVFEAFMMQRERDRRRKKASCCGCDDVGGWELFEGVE